MNYTFNGVLPKLLPGDVVTFQPGTYSGFDARKLVGVKFLAPVGPVIFSSTIFIGGTSGVTFDGNFVSLSGTTFDAGFAINENFSLLNWDFGRANKVIDAAGNRTVGDLFRNLIIDGFKFSGNAIYSGTWEAPTTNHSTNTGMIIRNGSIVHDGSQYTTKVFGNSIFNFLFENLLITGEALRINDVGVFQIQSGYGTVKNCKRNGGYGYLGRIWIVGGDFNAIGNIDTNTNAYGTWDIRNDASLGVGGNANIINGTSGDKFDAANTYVTPMVVVGSMNGFSLNIENCFAYNAQQNGMSNNTSILKNNSGGALGINIKNNVDIVGALPDGYIVDKGGFVPVAGGPLFRKATSVPGVSIKDIGAVQAPDPIPVPTIKSIVITYSDGTTKTII